MGPYLRPTLLAALTIAACSSSTRLSGRAVLPAATFADGPTSGQYLDEGPIHGQEVPFVDAQPVQGFSAMLDEGDGVFLVMSDNGFGAIENSADYHLRVYRIRPDFVTVDGGSGSIDVLDFFELSDPEHHLPFTITNELTTARVLTGADLDIESFQRSPDGSFWFGDEFGPFLVHTDDRGRVLEPPYPLPDPRSPDGGGQLRSPQSPLNEEGSVLRLMNAVRANTRRRGSIHTPVVSPSHLLLVDEDPSSFVSHRQDPPEGFVTASSEIFDVASLQHAGFTVVPWTVNDRPRMDALIALGVDGLISDRPDLLRQALEAFDTDDDGSPGLLLPNGLVDRSRFDAQGHRGARGLRPENTLPAFEAALDHLMSTLETDVAVSADGVPILSHEPTVSARLCSREDGDSDDVEPLIMSLTVLELQSTYQCDRLLDRFPEQRADHELSPIAAAYANARGLTDMYVMPTLAQLFDFVSFYGDFYRDGEGRSQTDAEQRWQNADEVRFNVEIKRDPRPEQEARTAQRRPFAQAVASVIIDAGLEARTDVQSFDLGSVLAIQEIAPTLRTATLFDDHNLGRDADESNPWLDGLSWPYRISAFSNPFSVRTSGGLEGMAISSDGTRLLPMLEKPLEGDTSRTLIIFELDLGAQDFSENTWRYELDEGSTSIGDFVMIDDVRGLVIERDDSEGDLGGFKVIYEITLGPPGELVTKRPLVDLLNVPDPDGLSLPGVPGDIGLGERFAFPFFTIECLLVLDPFHIVVANDNNFPLSVGRHVGASRPDDSEIIVIELAQPLM